MNKYKKDRRRDKENEGFTKNANFYSVSATSKEFSRQGPSQLLRAYEPYEPHDGHAPTS